jgi:hypothetical protein
LLGTEFVFFLLFYVNYVAEQPYDSIPNFTAADALRLTGVGRNGFIDIMNKCRSKVILDMILWAYTMSERYTSFQNIDRFQVLDHLSYVIYFI